MSFYITDNDKCVIYPENSPDKATHLSLISGYINDLNIISRPGNKENQQYGTDSCLDQIKTALSIK